VCIYLVITLIFTGQCTIFGPFYLNKYAWQKRPPKIPTTQICVAFVLGQKRQKPVANFLYLPGRKNGHPKNPQLEFLSLLF